MLLNVPMEKAKRACEISVQITLYVKMRRKGRQLL
jgi:hypothetical protein